MVVKQFLVQTHVLVLGENGIVVLEAVLFQERGVTLECMLAANTDQKGSGDSQLAYPTAWISTMPQVIRVSKPAFSFASIL